MRKLQSLRFAIPAKLRSRSCINSLKKAHLAFLILQSRDHALELQTFILSIFLYFVVVDTELRGQNP